MPPLTVELAAARELAAQLLDELGIEAYLYEIEPLDDRWEIRVECAIDGGWETLRWPIEKSMLLAAREDRAVRRELIDAWRGTLAACKRRGS